MKRSLIRLNLLTFGLFVLAMGSASAAVELKIHATAIQKILDTEVFTQNGRNYLFGEPTTPCMSAYLADPKVSMKGGKLHVKMHFTGSIGREIGENCIGLSDDFDVTMTGIPVFRQGTLSIDSVEVTGLSGNPKFDEYVVAFVKQELPKMIEYKLLEEIQKLLVENRDEVPFRIDLLSLDIPRIEVREHLMVLTLDVNLEIK